MTQRGVIASAHWMPRPGPRGQEHQRLCAPVHETRAIVIPLPPVRVSCVCSSAHWTRAVPIVFKLSRGKAFFRPVFGTATPSTGTSVASSRGEGRLMAGLRHSNLAYRYFSAIPAWRRGHLSALWHGDPQLKHFWGRVACRRKGNRYRCRAYGRVHDRVWLDTPGYR